MENRPKKGCCGEIDLSHIGDCMHCFVLATTLTLLSWTAFILVAGYYDWPWISSALFILSCLFSLLLLTHAIASFTRKNTKLFTQAGPASHPR